MMYHNSTYICSLLAALALALLAGCAAPGVQQARRPVKRPPPRVEEVLLDGPAELPGIYSTGDGFWSLSFVLAADGTLAIWTFPDTIGESISPVPGHWRWVDRRTVDIEWRAEDGATHRDRLGFFAYNGQLGFIEESRRREVEARRQDWRERILVKHEPPHPVFSPAALSTYPRAERPPLRAALALLVAAGLKPEEYFAEVIPHSYEYKWRIALRHQHHPVGDLSFGDSCGKCRWATYDPDTGTLSPLRGIR